MRGLLQILRAQAAAEPTPGISDPSKLHILQEGRDLGSAGSQAKP